MTLTKNKMVRLIGQRTRLKNRQVQLMLEALIDICLEELSTGGRIELENFIVLEVQSIDRGESCGLLGKGRTRQKAPRYIRRVTIHSSKRLKRLLNMYDPSKSS